MKPQWLGSFDCDKSSYTAKRAACMIHFYDFDGTAKKKYLYLDIFIYLYFFHCKRLGRHLQWSGLTCTFFTWHSRSLKVADQCVIDEQKVNSLDKAVS